MAVDSVIHVYVRGNVHTQTIEGFWSLVQNGIRGVYRSVSKKYLRTYLDEYGFRNNRRDSGNLLFLANLERVSVRRLSKPSAPSPETQVV